MPNAYAGEYYKQILCNIRIILKQNLYDSERL